MANALAWINAASIVPDLFWAKLNEGSGTTFADSSVQGHNGTIANSAQWIAGVAGNALNFDGATYWASTTGNIAYSSLNTITVSTWWKPTGLTVGVILESSADENSNDGSWLIYDGGDGMNFGVVINSGPAGGKTGYLYALPSTGNWHNVLAVLNMSTTPGTIAVYVDTVLQTPTGTLVNASVASTFLDYQLFMGARNHVSTFLNGGIDDVRVYSGDKSALVVSIYNNPQ